MAEISRDLNAQVCTHQVTKIGLTLMLASHRHLFEQRRGLTQWLRQTLHLVF